MAAYGIILPNFGFHTTFIEWTPQCVSTPFFACSRPELGGVLPGPICLQEEEEEVVQDDDREGPA